MRAERQKALELRARFEAAGAALVEPPVLLPADTLLDLYGEDIRGRAYVTYDALRGEQMLRPDFTVPVVEMHMADGATPARYTYAGEVFRKQEEDPDRANEYIQVGYEVFAGGDPANSDAEVFALIAGALKGLDLRPVCGDIGILLAAVRGLNTSEARKNALLRHVWRPRRFRSLLERFSGRRKLNGEGRVSSIAKAGAGGPQLGLRQAHEIEARIEALRAEAKEPPLSAAEVASLEALMAVRETLPFAHAQLQDIAVDLPSVEASVTQFGQRIKALEDQGVDVETLEFEASYGRSSMEYYDGFVFGLHSRRRADLPPVATGGRYDALTRRLGGTNGIPAVGAVIRPGLVLQLEGAA